MSDSGSPAPVTTTVLWGAVVGVQLEELLYGLLEEMGARDLVWRAGSQDGVSAPDNGRDLEAVFIQATPEGEEERTRWWIECKGRNATVPRDEVTKAVNSITARSDIDVFVVCTNSRFSNPTRDWIADWQSNHPRPKVRLWDKDTLDRLVRKYPTVAARTLPEALDNPQRLDLLINRFWALGETPTGQDLEYFWDNLEVVAESERRVLAVAMFAYSESPTSLAERPWAILISDTLKEAVKILIIACFELPARMFWDLARPADTELITQAAAYLILSIMPHRTGKEVFDIINNISIYITPPLIHPLADPETAQEWMDLMLNPIFTRVRDELADVCTDDCARIISEPRRVTPRPMLGKQYWRRFGVQGDFDDLFLTITQYQHRCVVGFDLGEARTCPLLEDFENSAERMEEFCAVVKFRRDHPEDQRWTVVDKPDIEEILASYKARYIRDSGQ